MKQEEKTSSKTLGILSIIFGCLVPIAGLVLGIVGISVKKSKYHQDRDITLNVVGIIVSIISWIIYYQWLFY